MTFVDVLRQRAHDQGNDRAYTFTTDGTSDESQLTYAELDVRARSIAAELQKQGMEGKPILLLFPPGLDYVCALAGCLYAGSTAVPGYPPRGKEKADLIRSILGDSRAAAVLTNRRWQARFAGDPVRPSIAIEDVKPELADGWTFPAVEDESIALLQYTSGSTSLPRGVMVSHENLAHNCSMIRDAMASSSQTRSVMWLPPYHDMGLVGGIMHPLYTGFPAVLMSPFAFLQRPYRWLKAVSDHRATVSGGPNFAFRLCTERILAEQKDSLDLSSWNVAFCGSEPIHAATLASFADAFESCGFRRESFFPCYGMAEATLIISGQLGEPVLHEASKAGLERGQVLDEPTDPEDTQTLVGCGGPLGGEEILVVNHETSQECRAGEIGEIWVASPSVARGYWHRARETIETFKAFTSDTRKGPFLRTGDLGYIRDGALFVTGRLKDLIIIHGRNLYPQDIELTAIESHPALRGKTAAAFSVAAPEDEGERLVVLQETGRHQEEAVLDEVLNAIRRDIAGQYDISAHAIVLVSKNSLPKTSSGKIRRGTCRTRFLEGHLDIVREWKQEEILDILLSELSKRLNADASGFDIRLPFAHWGLDSLKAVELAAGLETVLGRSLPATLAYDYPTIEALAAYLSGTASRPHQARLNGQRPKVQSAEPIAIIGIGCRLPGAHGPDAYSALLREGRDAISEIPPDRWKASAYFDADPDTPGKINTRWGGFLTGIDQFDPDFFGISRREAARMDPQQRLLLETAWEACEDAGLSGDRIAGSPTGVFVGISTNDYGRRVLQDSDRIDAYAGTGNAFSIAANRLSHVFDLHGPSIAIDTACSSSLVAVNLACASLRSNECSLALAGGVNLILSPEIAMNFSRAHAMASDGRCKAFDARADGYVRSEGAGVVVLKPLSRAVQDGDPVYAVVRGTAVNQDGRTNGIMAPSRQAQEDVIAAAYRNAGADPADVEYVETHGTGTLIGDSIEAAALGAVMARGRKPTQNCIIGSAKTNIGHLEAAAEIAGLIKTALMFDRGEIPPNLHFETPNPHIHFEELGLSVQRDLSSWSSASTAIAGVSSFGFGGTNAHVVVSAASPLANGSSHATWGGPYVLPLSAHKDRALEMRAEGLHGWLAALAHRDNSWLHHLCYTASVRRTHHKHRAAFVFYTRDELFAQLRHFLQGEEHRWCEPQEDGPDETMARSLASGYLEGSDVAWERLYPDGGKCIRLPEYPWQGERCWFDPTPIATPPADSSHPLLGSRLAPESSPIVKVWENRIGTGTAAFLRGHRFQGVQIFPATAYLEMAFAAAREEFGSETCVVKNVEFQTPLVVPEEGQRMVQFELSSEDPDNRRFRILSSEAHDQWVLHASGTIAPGRPPQNGLDGEIVKEIRERCQNEILTGTHYSSLQEKGLEYGASFRQMQQLWTGPAEALARIEIRPETRKELAAYRFHPGVLDCCAQFLSSIDTFGTEHGLPVALGEIRLYGSPTGELWSHAVCPSEGVGDVRVFDSSGRVVVDADRLQFRRLDSTDCQYEVEWREQPEAEPLATPEEWLVFSASDGLGEELAANLKQGGRRCTLVSDREPESSTSVLDTLRAERGVRTLGVVYLRAVGVTEATAEDCKAVAGLVGQMAESHHDSSFRLWLVTRGAQSLPGDAGPAQGGPLDGTPQAPLWGLGRTIALEHPQIWGGLIDLDPSDGVDHARALANEFLSPSPEDQIAFRSLGHYVPRFVHRRVPASPAPVELRPDCTYLITGGLGGLGLQLARSMVERGARRLVLLARTALPPRSAWSGTDRSSRTGRQIAGVRWLEQMGASVHLASVDVANQGQLFGFLEDFHNEAWPPIRGVIHAAGVLNDQVLLKVHEGALEEVFRAKVYGAALLHRAFGKQPLDFFVLFSSVASLLGSEGQASYAAANAFLDSLAHSRRQEGLPALAINWGPWAEAGMAGETGAASRLSRRGIEAIQPQQGLAIFERLLCENPVQVCVLGVDWPKLLRHRPALRGWKFLSEMERTTSDTDSDALARILQTAPEERPCLVKSFLIAEVARIVAASPEDLDPGCRLSDHGIDSLMSMELKTSLEEQLGIEIPAVTFLKDPTIAEFAQSLLERVISKEHTTEVRGSPVAVQIARGGQAPPVFFMHPGGLDVRLYDRLAFYLDDRPLYALTPGLANPTIEESATACADEICRIQSEGALAVGGWSLGGILAFEVARQLRLLDRDVEVVFFLDSPAPPAAHFPVADDPGLVSAFGSYLGTRHATLVRFDAGGGLDRLFQQAKQAGVIPQEQGYDEIVSLFESYRIGLEVSAAQFQDYAPGTYAGRTALFRATGNQDSDTLFPPDAFHWQKLTTREPEIYSVPGDHYTMFLEPHVRVLGALLNKCLNGLDQTMQAENTGAGLSVRQQ